VAASKPLCPTLLIYYVAALRAKEGSPLEGWEIWLLRAAAVADGETRAGVYAVLDLAPRNEGQAAPAAPNRDWLEHYLAEADRARLDVLRTWALAAEERLGRWPRTLEEVLAEAPPAAADDLRRRPVRRAAVLAGVRLLPDTRDIAIDTLTARQVEEARADLLQRARAFEASRRRRPRDLRELELESGRPVPPPPRHGTRWDLDPATGEPRVVPDPADPRVRR
jgi:hypothetical protein